MRLGNGRNRAAIDANEEKAARHENQNWQQLGNCEEVADSCSHNYAANVCECQSADQNGEDHKTVERPFCWWPEPRHVVDEDISHGGGRTNPCQPQKPPGLQTQEATEGDSCVQIRASGLTKAGGNLGEASGNYPDSSGCYQVSNGTLTPQKAGGS